MAKRPSKTLRDTSRKKDVPERGIDPGLLISQVQGTMPYLFDESRSGTPLVQSMPARVVLERVHHPDVELSHFEYFRLCLSAHFLTVGTPVPTDVDNQIRKKLWSAALPLETVLPMAELVLEARSWPYELFSPRYQPGAAGIPGARSFVSGHQGEWFTVAAAAYAGLAQFQAPETTRLRERVFTEISEELRTHSDVFSSLWRAGDGVGCLKASASIAHNLGDLDRVMDQWELAEADPLRVEHYKLGSKPFGAHGRLRLSGNLWVAGELYKSLIDGGSMAAENHRHFALRKPKVLRTRPEFLLPNGPFLDEWGTRVLGALEVDPDSRSEVIQALVEGWIRLPGVTSGYGRALHGVFEHEGYGGVLKPLKEDRQRRRALELARVAFEKRWASEALKHLEEIPSRAG